MGVWLIAIAYDYGSVERGTQDIRPPNSPAHLKLNNSARTCAGVGVARQNCKTAGQLSGLYLPYLFRPPILTRDKDDVQHPSEQQAAWGAKEYAVKRTRAGGTDKDLHFDKPPDYLQVADVGDFTKTKLRACANTFSTRWGVPGYSSNHSWYYRICHPTTRRYIRKLRRRRRPPWAYKAPVHGTINTLRVPAAS
ncbi:hypothetical protein BDQ17DRAFT_537226 [Cyathus striatus]|nr:hypothetical protein BDQ17DRAFT_537226 [Cyathus striatus]